MNKDVENAEDADIIAGVILYGGHQAGFKTNRNSEKVPCFIEVGGQRIVCIAQGGECRYNSDYYSPGLRDTKSWTTPIVDESCPDQCCYKVLVCDEHGDKCEGSIEYYPQYNKFAGLYRKYCRNFDKYIKNDNGGNGKKEKKGKMKIREEKGKDGGKITTWSYY